MRILILTPLFPPDNGDPAAYVKELAARMSGHETQLLIYGHLPESVPGVAITAIDKRQWLLKRLLSYTIALWGATKDVDIVIINNAPSTELPALIVSLLQRRTWIICESDTRVVASRSGVYKIIHRLLQGRCRKTIRLPDESLYKKPEVLPFIILEPDITTKREVWWEHHLKELTTI